MTQSRTIPAANSALQNAGETVTLVGWMENIREDRQITCVFGA